MNSIYYHLVIDEYDKLNDKHITYDDINYLINSLPHVSYYSYILHDKDLNERKHYHINIEFDNAGYVQKSVLNKVASTLMININCVGCRSCNADTFYKLNRYLIHIDDSDKYQYDESEVITNNIKKYSNTLIGVNPFSLDMAFLIYLVKSSDTLTELYCKLGLGFSNHYYKIIQDLRKSKGSL